MQPNEDLRVETSPKNEPWQFSLRSLLIVTAVVSVCLAIGVHFAGAMAVVIAFGAIQAGMLLAADWLICPAQRRVLAFVTAGSWSILGSGLIVLGGREAYQLSGTTDEGISRISALCLIIGGAFCYYVASKRWRRLTRQSTHDSSYVTKTG